MIPTPQQAMIAVLAAGALAAGAYFYGRHDGRELERAGWMERDNAALREANAALDALQRKYRADEQKRAADQAKLVADYEEELHHAENARDRALADVRAGKLRLRDATACGTAGARGVPDAAAGPAAGVPAAAGAELPGSRDEAVIRLLGEADDLAREVNLCWSIVRRDREPASK